MIHEVRVSALHDIRGQELTREIYKTFAVTSINEIRTVKVYRFEGLRDCDIAILVHTILAESIDQQYTINAPIICDAVRSIEIGYKQGVMNPEVASLYKVARDLHIADLTAADTSWEYHVYGHCNDEQLQCILDRLLMNKTIERIITQKPRTLHITGSSQVVHIVSLCTMNDTLLLASSRERQLFLDLDEMHAIQEYFITAGRDPYDAELETIAQTWSEHCSHKTFKARLVVNGIEKKPLFTRLKEVARQYSHNVISAFVDNAGVFRFYDGYAIAGKVETHNSPSAIEPYGGAATGSGGVFRDIMGTGQGAQVIASTDMFCCAPPDMKLTEVPPGCLHPSYVLRKVVAGVRDYGNRMGIPTNNGSVHFHPDFRAKPTVIVGAYGLLPESMSHKGMPHIGDRIILIGGRTGRDGIHGATFSSGSMDAQTITIAASAVQIGNAIEEKRMADALCMCRDAGLIRAITDCGAGGLSSAVGEMGAPVGVRIFLERVPLKYVGLAPWEIWVSESQERMICAIDSAHTEQFKTLCAHYNVETTDIGYCTGEQRLQVTYENNTVCDIDMHFLHNGCPQRVLRATAPINKPVPDQSISVAMDILERYYAALRDWNVCSKEPIVRQYDHGVQGTNVLPPFTGNTHHGPNDAVVLTPLHGKPYGLIISHGLNPVFMRIDPYKGGLWAIAEALSNLVAVGGDVADAVLIDNFIWPTPDEYLLWDLDQAMQACIDAMHAFKIPFISGKDSLSSTYRYPTGEILNIPPVLCISVFGKVADVSKTVSADFKYADSYIVLVGDLDAHLGFGDVPDVHLVQLPTRFATIYKAIVDGHIHACHDISEGGIAVALAEMCFGTMIGATIDINAISDEFSEHILFNETAGCFLVEMSADVLQKNIFAETSYYVLGRTTHDQMIKICKGNTEFCSIPLKEAYAVWQKPIKGVFGS